MQASNNPNRRFFLSSHLDYRGPFKRERRRQLEIAELHPPRIRISARLNGWLVHEVLAWENLLTAGLSGDAMREAIRGMVAARPKSALVHVPDDATATKVEAEESLCVTGSAD
jgi:hypothetical protein